MKKRRIDLETAMQNTYLDLITDYLAKELDPLKAAEVERQLETDPAFRDFAAPIVAAWNARRRPR
jgi:anti-sigma factor RsiW